MTFVWFFSTVNSAAHNKAVWLCESFAANSTFKWFLCWITFPVSC